MKNKQDIQKLRRRAYQGDREAQWELGSHYRDGLEDARGNTLIARSGKRAVFWFKKSSESGHPGAQMDLGNCLSEGQGAPRDIGAALYWTKKAHANGQFGAASNTAAIYRDRLDYKNAFKWLQIAGESQDGDAFLMLGQFHYFGLGTQPDHLRAVHCFQKAIHCFENNTITQHGYEKAQCHLGLAYLQGNGVVKSVKKARELFRSANKDKDNILAMEMELIVGRD